MKKSIKPCQSWKNERYNKKKPRETNGYKVSKLIIDEMPENFLDNVIYETLIEVIKSPSKVLKKMKKNYK